MPAEQGWASSYLVQLQLWAAQSRRACLLLQLLQLWQLQQRLRECRGGLLHGLGLRQGLRQGHRWLRHQLLQMLHIWQELTP